MDNKRLQEINERKIEIRQALESDETVNLDELRSEIEKLNAEAKEIEERAEIANKM